MTLPDIDQPVTDEVLVNSSVLPQECSQLPDESQKAILTMLARIEKINQTGAWFRPRTVPEINSLIPQIWEIARGLFAANCLGAFRVAGDSWQEALNKATAASQVPRPTDWKVIYDLAHSTAEGPAAEAAQKISYTEAWRIAELAAREAGLATACLTEENDPEKINPHSLIWELHEMGAAGINFATIGYKLAETDASIHLPSVEMLTIHLPITLHHPIADTDLTYLACLAFNPDGSGDSNISYAHSIPNHNGCPPRIRLFSPPGLVLL